MGNGEKQVFCKDRLTIQIKYLFNRFSCNLDGYEGIDRPDDFPEELWKIIDLMVQVEPDARRPLKEVNKII
jgi:hypothetical protein